MSSEMLLANKYLSIVQNRGKKRMPLKRVYRNMREPELFLKAYAKIYKNAGATTIGTDPNDTIQGMSLKRVEKIIEQLRNGTYQWKPSRKVYIPKSNGSKRPLSVPNWSDKLVQEVIKMILEAYYEPQFRESSHGFRPKRGCHTALWQVKHKWTGSKWFIEGDIKGCFDNIHHETLINILSRKIQDNRFLKLIREMLQAGYMEDWKYHQTYSGTPQGGIASPILANIVLDELDSYIEDILIPQYTKNKRRRHNSEYYRLSARKLYAKQQGNKELYKQLYQEQRKHPEGDPNDSNYRRLRYVRYADDFLLGFTGSKLEAQTIKNQIGQYLQQIHLSLSAEKTSITHAQSGKAKFLGYEITTMRNDNKISKRNGKIKTRSINGNIQLRVSITACKKWVIPYIQNRKPHQIGGYIDLSDFEIIGTYGSQLRGLVNYYSLADNIAQALRYVRWVCMESARKTLAAKHKIRHVSNSYKRYLYKRRNTNEWSHLRVTIQRPNKSSLIAKCGETPLCTRKSHYISGVLPPKVIAGTRSELLTRLLKGECELCRMKADLEAHHINKVATLRKRWKGRKEKPKWVENMIARNRKTIVVCHTCHQNITHGRYDGRKLE